MIKAHIIAVYQGGYQMPSMNRCFCIIVFSEFICFHSDIVPAAADYDMI